MREIALHLLDIAENSVAAQARNIRIDVLEDLAADRLRLVVEDDGRGMDAEMLERVVDPFITTRTTRKVGLGIPLFKAAAEACDGYFNIQSRKGEGTRIEVEFQHSHIDRMPLGDLACTFLTLEIGFPEIHWIFHYEVRQGEGKGTEFHFDDQEIKEQLEGIPLTEPPILAYIRNLIEDGIASVKQSVPKTVRNI